LKLTIATKTLTTKTLARKPPAAKTLPFQERETKVAAAVRDALLEVFPELREDTPLSWFCLRLFNHLLSPARPDEDTGGKVIPRELIARFAGVECDSNFVAREWLDNFRSVFGDRMEIEVGDWVPFKKARTIAVDWPVPIQEALAASDFYAMSTDDIDKIRHSDRVYLVSGQKVSRRRLGREKQKLILLREDVSASLPPEAMQRFLQDLLNDHLTTRAQTISKVLREGLPRLLEWLEVLPASSDQATRRGKTISPEGQRRYRQWLTSLPGLLTEPFPAGYYRSGDKSVRLHSSGFIPHYLPRGGRAALLGHLTRLDLRSSQFAIAARLWGAQKTLKELKELSGLGSIWDYFLRELAGETRLAVKTSPAAEASVKPALKTCLYSLCFGMHRRWLRANLVWDLRDAGFGKKSASRMAKGFLGLDLMEEMLEARERALQGIRDSGGVRLPDWECQGVEHKGAWLELDTVPKHWLDPEAEIAEDLAGWGFGCQESKGFEHNVRSLLAQQMQAAEMGIMLAAAEVIAKTHGITIVSFLHDGLTLAFRDEGKQDQQTRAIQNAVSRHCKAKGYHTSLQLEDTARV